MKDQCKSCAKWRRCKDRSRGVACAEYKKAPAERQLQQGHKKNVNFIVTENGRKGKENEYEKI